MRSLAYTCAFTAYLSFSLRLSAEPADLRLSSGSFVRVPPCWTEKHAQPFYSSPLLNEEENVVWEETLRSDCCWDSGQETRRNERTTDEVVEIAGNGGERLTDWSSCFNGRNGGCITNERTGAAVWSCQSYFFPKSGMTEELQHVRVSDTVVQ
ncbi:hypothetical protein IRJ41_016104 [Triplophysa rosa]|uniref:Uncharacterized protein n=1 Tax=Triplophysa rosa TaxID=992332 RepID=A0A9W7TLT6_TRIRA|nr:hypothetical protein IRJ41_016104 [Triplophysa rosa]